MQIHQILASAFNQPYPMPTDAILRAVERREEVKPVLLGILRDTVARPNDVDFESRDPIVALYLLSFFREQKAFPYVMSLASFPEAWVREFFGDLITEDLTRYIVSTYDGNLGAITGLIENKGAELYCRSAAAKSLLGLLVEEKITRDWLIAYYRTLISTPVESEEERELLNHLALDIYMMWPQELYAELKNLLEQEHIDEFLFGGIAALDAQRARGLDHCMDELRGYKYISLFKDLLTAMSWLYREPESYRLPRQVKLGRNEPCFCSSGKKYKKCCSA